MRGRLPQEGLPSHPLRPGRLRSPFNSHAAMILPTPFALFPSERLPSPLTARPPPFATVFVCRTHFAVNIGRAGIGRRKVINSCQQRDGADGGRAAAPPRPCALPAALDSGREPAVGVGLLRERDGGVGGGRALVVERQFLGSEWWAVQEEVREWAEVRGRLACRVIRYELQSDSQLCQSVYTLRALLQLGNCSLLQQLHSPQHPTLHPSHLTLAHQPDTEWGVTRVLSLLKFMLDTALELRGRGWKWIQFHPATIIHFRTSNHYRFLALPHSLQTQQPASYPSPERYSGNTCLPEHSTVFSIGMVLLALLLREDCSDCYNPRTPAFCRSAFEHKLQHLQERAAQHRIPALQEQSSCGPSPLQDGLVELVYALTAAPEGRISLAEGRKRYNGMLQQLSHEQIKPSPSPPRNPSPPRRLTRVASPSPLPPSAALHFQNMVDSVTQRGRRWEGGRVGEAGQKDRANPAGKLKQRSKQEVQTDKENFPLPANSVPS